ncbi:hypothetical protein [Flaviflagellibacter deserti]|uniref:Uncharacterized protein n=1 Tax=Flaviflagellibacter deserti TaxID=2267266 RepID=A0ABV9Z1G2_9HYPH
MNDLAANARRILDLLQSADPGPHQFVLTDILSARFRERGGSAEDFQLGLAYGVGEGWFVFEDVTVRLTLKGASLLV